MIERAIVTQINPSLTPKREMPPKPVDLDMLDCHTAEQENRVIAERQKKWKQAATVVSNFRYIRSCLSDQDTSLEGSELNHLSAILAAGVTTE